MASLLSLSHTQDDIDRVQLLQCLILVERVPHGKGLSGFELLPVNGAVARCEQCRAEFHSCDASMFVDIGRIRIQTNLQHQSIEIRGIVRKDVPLVLIGNG